MIRIFTILLLTSFFSAKAQNKFHLNKYCENSKIAFDSVLVEKKIVRFQIIDFAEMRYGKWNGEYSVECILPDYSSKSEKSEIKAIAESLKKLDSKFTQFTFYKSCEVYHIYISSTYPTRESAKKLEEGYIGEFEILK